MLFEHCRGEEQIPLVKTLEIVTVNLCDTLFLVVTILILSNFCADVDTSIVRVLLKEELNNFLATYML